MNLVAKLKKALRSLDNALRYGGETISIRDDTAMSVLFGKESNEVCKNFKVIYDDRMDNWDVPTHPFVAEIRKEFGSAAAFMSTISVAEFQAIEDEWRKNPVNAEAAKEHNNIIALHNKEVENAKHFISHIASKRHIYISFERGIHIEDFPVMKYGRVIAYISML